MNRHQKRRAKAVKDAPLFILVEFARRKWVPRTKASFTCFTCGGEANNWPVDDDPAQFAFGLAEVRRGKESAAFRHEGEMLTDLPLCEACYGSPAETGTKLLREIYGDHAKFDESFEVSEEVAEAMMDKPSSVSEH